MLITCPAIQELAADGVAPSRAEYYRWLSGQLRGGMPYPDACRVPESMFPPWKAADLFGPYQPGRHMLHDGGPDFPGTVLGSVPHGFRADALSGYWVTCYQFRHGGQDGTPQHHADIACITAESDRRIQAVNHPPEPRTEGRANPFRNQIEAELADRHLIGHWKNISDTRYFGSLHLAVLPGETVMDGYYTGVESDIEVPPPPGSGCGSNPAPCRPGREIRSVRLRGVPPYLGRPSVPGRPALIITYY